MAENDEVIVVHQRFHLAHIGVCGVEFAQVQLACNHLFCVADIFLHPFAQHGREEGGEVHVADHGHQRLIATVVGEADEVGRECGIEHHRLWALALVADAYGTLQLVEGGIAR